MPSKPSFIFGKSCAYLREKEPLFSNLLHDDTFLSGRVGKKLISGGEGLEELETDKTRRFARGFLSLLKKKGGKIDSFSLCVVPGSCGYFAEYPFPHYLCTFPELCLLLQSRL